MGLSAKENIHDNTSLPQETRENPNKEPSSTPQVTKKGRNEEPQG